MSIMIYKNDEQQGPFELAIIKQGLTSGRFTPEDFAWQEGCADWVPLRTLVAVDSKPSISPAPSLSSKLNGGLAKIESSVSKFLGEDQDATVVVKVLSKAQELLTTGEAVQYIGIQKKPIVTIAPDAVLLTNKRFIIVRPKMLGMTFQDFQWREVVNVHMSEQMLSATISCQVVGGMKVEIDSIPKKQARKIYTYAQEVEERMHEERRHRSMEEMRAGAGGVIIQAPAHQAASASNVEDPLAVLGKLKKMLDAGLIEPAEFEAKKADILARM